MLKHFKRPHIGLRTAKTAVAVILSMFIVDLYGATSSKLIFATLGAMAAVQPTFKASLESCLTQIVGVLFGYTHLVPHQLLVGIGADGDGLSTYGLCRNKANQILHIFQLGMGRHRAGRNPLPHIVFGIGLVQASACAKVSNMASNLTSVVLYAFSGNILYMLALPAAACSVVGGWCGAKVAVSGGGKRVKQFMYIVLVLLFVKLISDLFTGA